MRTPDRDGSQARPPRGGAVYAVRYLDSRGEAVTYLFRFRAAADRMMGAARDAGGTPVLYAIDVPPTGWRVVG